MEVSSTSSLTGQNTTNGSSASSGIADNFDSFLSILTTQLKNQNPLEPLDTNAFTQQLVQFSQVEQQLQSNKHLQALIQATQSADASKAVSFVGQEITTATPLSVLSDEQAVWEFDTASSATKADITVKDASGAIVFSKKDVPVNAGTNTFVWDGKNENGTQLQDGPYGIVVDAKSAEGEAVSANVKMVGTVEGVDFSGAETFLMIGDSRISLESVLTVRAPKART